MSDCCPRINNKHHESCAAWWEQAYSSENRKRNAAESQVVALTASLASVTHELEETKRWLQEEGARGNTCRAENAALAKEIERNKYEFEVSHRVVQAHKQAEQNAVRIGCENITAREKAEASLASATKERDALADEQCGSECVKAHGELAELRKQMAWYERVAEAAQVSDRYRGKTVEEDHVAGRCGCDPMVGFSDPDCCIDRGISQALASPPSQGEQK